MDNLILRVEALVPRAQMATMGQQITEWYDQRQQPTEAELLAVDVVAAKADVQAKAQETDDEITNNILNNKTYADVDTYIDNQFATAVTVAAMKIVVIKVLKIYGKLILAIAKKQGLSD